MKEDKDSLGTRMKSFEFSSTHYLTRKIPVIIRVDGKAFHTFCKRFEKPYDKTLNGSLNGVMFKLCSQIQGVKIAQRHSDEISFVVTDYDKVTTDSFFEYNISKICSVVASMATAEFCRQLVLEGEIIYKIVNDADMVRSTNEKAFNIFDFRPLSKEEDWPTFDCRCFNLNEFEIGNYLWWRLLDCKRGSINMLAQCKFSQKELHGKNCDQMQEMLFQTHGINWAKLPQEQKAGFLCVRKKVVKPIEAGPNKGQECERNIWEVQPAPSTKVQLDEILKGISFRDDTQE